MMSEYMMGFALLGALMLTAPMVLADYALFKEWREEKGAVYPEGSEVVTLLTIGKDGDLGRSDGTLWWDNYGNDAWTIESNYQDFSNRFWINVDGSELAKYYDIGIALTGSLGSFMPEFSPNGLRKHVSFYFEEHWIVLELVLGPGSASLNGVEYQSYLNGTKINNGSVNITNDAMQTFIWCPDVAGLLGIDSGDSGFGIRLDNALRNGSSVSIVAIRKPTEVPEPATLTAVGLGLAGLGLARRRK